MKFIPKNLFKSKKTRSDDPSFSSGSTTSSSENSLHKSNGLSTPTTVLPTLSNEIHWSEISTVDVDGDGKVRKEQLEAILTRLGGGHEPLTEEEVVLLLNEDFETISSAFEPASLEDGSDELKVAFDFFDADHDGKITAEELLNVFGIIGDERCTLEDCKRMIRGVDKNGDGFVCLDDFCLMMEQQQR